MASTWEYRTEVLPGFSTYGPNQIDATLNGLGSQGWELVGVGADVGGGGGHGLGGIDSIGTRLIAFLKRPT
jgi:hypothetical protein